MISGIGSYLPDAAGFAALAATLCVALSLLGLGTVLVRSGATVESLLLSGWGLAVAIATVAGTLLPLALGWILCPLFLLGAIAFAINLRPPPSPWVPDAGRLLLIGVPLLILVSASSASQWDEFAHWLPNQRYLVEVGMFPRRGLPESASGFAAYPYGLALIGFGVSRLTGGFAENAGALFNTLLIPFLGGAAIRAFRAGTGMPDLPISWLAAAGAVAAATLLNPTFVPKLVFTTYADWPTTVALGVAAILAWRIVEMLAVGERHRAIGDSLPLGFVLALTVGLKQPNVILVGLLLVGMSLVIALGPRLQGRDWMRLGLRAALPTLVVYVAWRHHVAQHIPGREFGFLPFEAWLWDALAAVLGRMALIASKKGGYFGLMLLAAGVAAYTLACVRAGALSPVRRLAVLVATVFLGYNAFLYVAYIGAFGRGEGQSAASYWRYNTQLGGMALVFGAALAGLLWRRVSPRIGHRAWIRPVFVAVVLLAQPAFGSKIRFDLNPVTRYVRSVGADMAAVLPPAARLIVIDPADNGKRALLLRYELAGRARVERLQDAVSDEPMALRRALGSAVGAYLWVHVPTPVLSEALDATLSPLSSYLVESTTSGWRVVRSWPYPGYTDPVAEDD